MYNKKTESKREEVEEEKVSFTISNEDESYVELYKHLGYDRSSDKKAKMLDLKQPKIGKD